MLHFKNIFFCLVIFLVLQSCSSANKSGSIPTSNQESTEAGAISDKKERNKDDNFDVNDNIEGEVREEIPPKPLKQVFIPKQKFKVERIISLKDSENESNISSESEKLSVSNKHAKVLLFAEKIQTGSYPIAKNNLPYATVHVILTQGQEKIEGDLENGTVNLFVLDSAGTTKGNFEGTLIKGDERYFIGGNFSN